jgi:hypothetical protein
MTKSATNLDARDARIDPADAKILAALLSQGTVCIVDISAFKASSGALWEALSASATGRLETLMRQSLGPNASFDRLDATRYAISMPGSTDEDANVTALSVAYKFFTAIQGRCELNDLRVSRVEKSASGELVNAVLRPEAIADLQDKAQLYGLVLPSYFRKKQLGVLTTAKNAPREGPAGTASHGKRPPTTLDLTVQHRFDPVWHVQNQAITTYICTPIVPGLTAGEVKFRITDLDMPQQVAIEVSALDVGLRFLSEYVEKGDRFILGVPVSFDIISSSAGRMKFASVCRCLPAMYRQYLVFFITHVPLGVTQTRLSECVALLRPFGKVVAFVASGCRAFQAYERIGLNGIALDLSNAPRDIERIKSDIVHLGAAGRNAKLVTMIYGINDAALVEQATAADIHLLHGMAVAKPLDTPRRMTHVPAAKIMPARAADGQEEWF